MTVYLLSKGPNKFYIFFPFKNSASLVVSKGVAKEENVLDNGQTNNIFTWVTIEKIYKISF